MDVFGKSPARAYVRLNRRLWRHVPASLTALPPVRSYGALLHRLVARRAPRRQLFSTFFFRNRPQLALIRRLAQRRPAGSTLRVAFLGCSNGAELYSVLWTIRTARPDLHIVARAVDISEEVLDLARKGVYSLTAPQLVGERIFARIRAEEMQGMFERDGDEVRVKLWLRDGIAWHLGDACSADLVEVLGAQDMVLANNFLCHMEAPLAERCLRNIARVVTAGGHLVVSGIDLDVRTRVAHDLGWTPVPDLLEAIHEGDPSVRASWPIEYWGLEPFNRRRRDWRVRYATVFQLGAPAVLPRPRAESAPPRSPSPVCTRP
jgi:chemotaxis methyl-accepting protein methylase